MVQPQVSLEVFMRRMHSRYGWDSLRLSLAALALATFVPTIASAITPLLQSPRSVDREVSRIIALLMRREHLTRHPIDDEISQRAMKMFLKNLDPMKVFFTQADVDEFDKHKLLLDDDFANGDIAFAYDVYKRYVLRGEERNALIKQLLAKDFDFTVDEILVGDPEKLTYAKNQDEVVDRWRKRLKYDYLVLKDDAKLKGDPVAIKERLLRRYNSQLKRMQQMDADELLETFLTSITSSFDPHTTYMSPSKLDSFRIEMSLQLEGIGAALQGIDGSTEISKLIPGGAAEKSGNLKVDDKIVSVGQGESGDMVDVVDMNLNEVVKLIRGKAGTIVRLGVLPGGGGELKTVRLERAKIELKDSEARGVVFEEGKKPDGSPYKIGVIELPSFYMDMEAHREGVVDYKSSTRDVQKILEKFNREGVDSLILDLRMNGGGSLVEAISLTGLFIDRGPVVQVKGPNGTERHDDEVAGMAWKGPMVVLQSKFSASASEILSGAIQDYRRGLVVGDTSTHGKGTVQSLLDVGPLRFKIQNPPNLGALKITMQQFYRPGGDSTQKRGVVSDLALPSLTDHMGVSEGSMDYPIEFDRVPAAPFGKYTAVEPAMIARLKEKSELRRRDSTDFQKLLKNIEKYKDQKVKKEVPLNEAKFAARRAELDADREDEKLGEEMQKKSDEVVKRDFYFNEVLKIAVDYVQELGAAKVAQAR